MWNYVAPLAGASTAGLVMLAGDLAGTSSAYNTPRVGRLTGETSGADQVVMMRNGAVLAFTAAESLATVSSSGSLRFPINTTIMSFLNGTSANAKILSTDGSNNITVGDSGAAANVSGVYLGAVSSGTIGFQTGGANRMTVTSSVVSLTGTVILKIPFGGTASTNGDLNFGTATARTLIGVRNAANSADIALLAVDASDNRIFGSSSASGGMVINGFASINIRLAGTDKMTLSGTAVTLGTSIYLSIPGAGTAAASGDIRMGTVTARTLMACANGASDIAVLAVDASANLWLGQTAAGGSITANTYIGGTTLVSTYINNAEKFTVASDHIKVTTAGTSVSAIGDVRFHTATARTLLACDAVGIGADIAIVSTDASDKLYFGATSTGTSMAVDTYLVASSRVAMAINGSTLRIEADGTGIAFFAQTPVARASAYTQTYSTASKTMTQDASLAGASPFATANPTGTSQGFGFANEPAWDAFMALVDKLVADVMINKKVINSIIDDMQSYGLFQ